MAFWTIIGTGIEGDTTGRTFGVTLNTADDTWTAGGGSVDMFFKSKSGTYKHVVIPEIGAQLAHGSTEIALFRNLIATSPVGATGTGRASEKGVNFKWKLDSK
ncbi:hypothetical protein [Microvirga pakistanensis]|uniref:hypothetical protein n=1 Tax=Microvirga pakistanensis TaxID=1682650 RepID=UPI00106B01F1|nr:hypothetical protein [Microvirga pakistanensis]